MESDLTDHLYCLIEVELKKENFFNKAFDNAINQLAPNGLKEIERKTIYLINYKRIILMKKFMYFIGFLGAFTLTAGVAFKLLHFPLGYELFSVGFLLLLLIFVPLYAFDRYKATIAKNCHNE